MENKFDIKHTRNSAKRANRAKIERDQRYVIVLPSYGGNLQTALRERDANSVSRDEVQNLQRSSWLLKFCYGFKVKTQM
jgi:protein involved in ribonucleotide reduction